MNNTDITIEPGRQDIVVERVFDAPRDVVFKALTDPKLIPSWWGPRQLTTKVDEMDVRAGGRWRYTQRDPQGNEFAFKGVYHDAVSPQLVISTFEFEGAPGHVALDTLTLEEVDGKTRYRSVSVFPSVADRDAAVQTGMESGMRETYERLDEVIEGILSHV